MDPNAALLLKRIMERYLMPREKWAPLWDLFCDVKMGLKDCDDALKWLKEQGYISYDNYYIPTPLADWAEEQGLLDAIPPSVS